MEEYSITVGEYIAFFYVVLSTLGYAAIWQALESACTDQCWQVAFDFIQPGFGDPLLQTEEDWQIHGDCEASNTRNEGRFIRAPANSWSNMAFVLVGNMMIGLAIIENHHLNENRKAVLSNTLGK